MILFDWPTREKVRAKIRREAWAEGFRKGLAEARAEWTAWRQRRDEAHARGEDFTEPSPADRNGDLG